MFKDRISRREAIVNSGKTLLGAAFLAEPQQKSALLTTGGAKPLLLPPPDSSDPAAHSLSENLFWNDILMEHAALFSMLLPTPDLSVQRAEAERFQRIFASQIERVRTAKLDGTNFAAANKATTELIKPFIEFKHSLLEAQNTGKIYTMIWPSFYEHAIDEAERAIARLDQLSSGVTRLDYAEVVSFWSGMMSDHASFLAHLLDEKETDLISTALDASAQFEGYKHHVQSKDVKGVDVLIAAEELIDFKTAAAKGVGLGSIRSIIPPMLADHVRREALKFVDELKRTGYRT